MYIFQQISVEPEILPKPHGACMFTFAMSHKNLTDTSLNQLK